MQLKKTSSILIFSVLLIIVAVGLLGASVYFLLESRSGKSIPESRIPAKPSDNAGSVSLPVSETLSKKIMSDTAAVLTALSADSVSIRLNEIYQMKKDLPATVVSKSNEPDTAATRKKINDLLEKVEQLRNRTTKVESENKFLKELLGQLSEELRYRQKSLDQAASIKSTAAASNKTNTKTMLSDFRFGFLGESNKEINTADNAIAVFGAFQVRNANEALYVIVVGPDGKILQTSSWDGGVFETAEGRKLYTYKITADGSETYRRINFSIPADNLQKGNYGIQVYCNGLLIGRASKTLI